MLNNNTTPNHQLALSHVRAAYPLATIIAVSFASESDSEFLFTIDNRTTVVADNTGRVEDVTNKVVQCVCVEEEVGMRSEFYPEEL